MSDPAAQITDEPSIPLDTDAKLRAETVATEPAKPSLPAFLKGDPGPEVGTSEWAESLLADDPVVHIIVGATKKEFILPKSRLCETSPYFNTAFNGPFAEATSSELILPDDDPDTFTHFVKWVFEIEDLRGEDMDWFGPSGPFGRSFKTNDFLDLYIFSDKFQCDHLKDFTMDHLQNHLRKINRFLSEGEMARIFSNTISTKVSPIRAFCAATMSYYILKRTLGSKKIRAIFKKVPGLMGEFIKFQGSMNKKGRKLDDDPRHRHRHDARDEDTLCDFHVHKASLCDAEPNCTEYCRPDYDDSEDEYCCEQCEWLSGRDRDRRGPCDCENEDFFWREWRERGLGWEELRDREGFTEVTL